MTDYIEPEIVVQTGHPHPVTALAFSHDGMLLASRGQHVAKIWDLRTGKELRAFVAKGEGKSIAISPDSQYLATTTDDGVKLWNIKTGNLVKTLSWASVVKFSPDGKILAIGENGGNITPWGKISLFDLQLKKYIFESDKKESNNIEAIEFSKNGKFFAYVYSGYDREIGTQGSLVIIVNTITKQEVTRISIPDDNRPSGEGWILSIAFNPDSRILATQHSGNFNYIKFFDVYTGKLLYSINSEKKEYSKTVCGQRSYPETIEFHKDGKILLHSIANSCKSKDDYNEIRLLDIEKNKVIKNIITNNVTSFALGIDSKIIATGHSKGDIKLWDLATGKYVKTLQGYAQQITAIDSNPVFPQVASGSFDNTIKVWSFTGEDSILKSLVGHKTPVVSLDFHPKGKFLISSEQFSDEGKHETFPHDLYSKPNDKKTNVIEKIKTWSINDGKILQTLVRSNNEVSLNGYRYSDGLSPRFQEVRFPRNVTFNPDGRMIAHGVIGGNVHIFDFKTGRELYTFFDAFASNYGNIQKNKKDSGKVAAFAFHPNGYQIIGNNEVWDIATRKKVKKINNFDVSGPQNFLKTGMLAINHDGLLIAGTCHEGFSACGAVCLASLTGYSSSSKLSVQLETGDKYDHVNTIIFHPEKNVLAAGYDNGMIILWDADRQKEIARLQGKGNNPINSLSFSADGRILYSSSFDAQIQLWDVRKRVKIASLVAVNDEDYVIFTPDHYYMATKKGLRGVAFRIGNESYPFEQFDAKLNRPDIIMKRIGYAKKELIDTYYKLYKKRLKKLNIEEGKLRSDFHIPELKIRNRENIPLVTKDKKIIIDIEAVDFKYLLKKLKIYINNIPVYGANGIDFRKKVQLHKQKIPLELTNSKNKIQVSVLNDNGSESLKETVYIEYLGAPSPSNLYVFAIGVSIYKEEMNNLSYAEKDSIDISLLFKKYAKKFDKVVINNITNKRAIKENILAIRNILEKTKVDDEVVLFFAGHGLLHNENDYYFATYDINFKSPVERGLSYEDIESLLYAAPARKKLLLIDTCHSGEVTEDYEIASFTKQEEIGQPNTRSGALTQLHPVKNEHPLLLQDIFADLQFSSGAMVFSAASGFEKAQENSEWKNGTFTHSILQGVTTSKADLNRDGLISVSELRNYVVDDVRSLTQEEQVPAMRKENLEFDFPVFTQR